MPDSPAAQLIMALTGMLVTAITTAFVTTLFSNKNRFRKAELEESWKAEHLKSMAEKSLAAMVKKGARYARDGRDNTKEILQALLAANDRYDFLHQSLTDHMIGISSTLDVVIDRLKVLDEGASKEKVQAIIEMLEIIRNDISNSSSPRRSNNEDPDSR